MSFKRGPRFRVSSQKALWLAHRGLSRRTSRQIKHRTARNPAQADTQEFWAYSMTLELSSVDS